MRRDSAIIYRERSGTHTLIAVVHIVVEGAIVVHIRGIVLIIARRPQPPPAAPRLRREPYMSFFHLPLIL